MDSHSVQYGESLSVIAKRKLGDSSRWNEIARINHIENPDMIFVGQELALPDSKISREFDNRSRYQNAPIKDNLGSSPVSIKSAERALARSFFFIVADEIDPFTKKVVRKVVFPHELNGNPELIRQIIKPDKYGFYPRDPSSPVSLGRHVLGRTDSNFISTSQRLLGSPLREGKRFWIDIEKVKKAGGSIYDFNDIDKDLDRIAAKTKDPKKLQYIKDILNISKSEAELIIAGYIPPNAIKSAGSMIFTRGLQFVTGVGIVLTTIDFSKASYESYETKSVKPIAEESIRQIGGWAGVLIGAKLGAASGALVGIQIGPGAIVTGVAGGVIGAVSGYFGAEWINKYVFE